MKNKLLKLMATAFLLVSSIILTTNGKVVQAASQNSQSEMRAFVRNTMAANHVRGSTVVIKNGFPQQISYGWAWYGKRLGNGNSRIVYPAGSLQKVVTGAMIVQLINENDHTSQHFSQYTKISRWYPNLKNANHISVGNLLTHTSGITATGTEINRGYNISEASAVNYVVRIVNNNTEGRIGSYYYNNANYILLAGIIRKLTNESYATNFQNRIINKLGLTHTYLYQNIPRGMTDAISYYWNGQHNYQDPIYVKRSLASQLPGAGNMFSTPKDYYYIQRGLTNGQILSKTDFNYLTHLKAKVTQYSGGVYLENNDQLKMAFGSLSGYHFGNWFQMSIDNQNGLIMFLNQTDNHEKDDKIVGAQILNHIRSNYFAQQ